MSDYGYPYMEAQLQAEPVQQQVYPGSPAHMAPVDPMPPPSEATHSYLHNLGKILQGIHSDQQAQQGQPQAPASGNAYSANNTSNPYAIEGGSPLDGLKQKKKPDAAAASGNGQAAFSQPLPPERA